MPDAIIHSFEDFWPVYVRAHREPGCRRLHFVGSLLVLIFAAATVWLGDYRLLASLPVIGYGFAWTGHFFIEGNRPATFEHPLWSLLGDWKMFWLMLIGRMDREVERAVALQANENPLPA